MKNTEKYKKIFVCVTPDCGDLPCTLIVRSNCVEDIALPTQCPFAGDIIWEEEKED